MRTHGLVGMAFATVAVLGLGCDGPAPSISPDEDASTVAADDAGPTRHLLPQPAGPATASGIAPSAGWTSPPECPLSTEASHCDACWSHDDGGAVSLGRNDAGDELGAAVASGDFNDDGYPDLALGAPGEDVGAATDAGRVYTYLGSSRGFQPWRVIAAPTPAASDRFGASLLAADFDGDGLDELVVAYGGAVSNTPIRIYEDDGSTFALRQTLTLSDMDPGNSTIATSKVGAAFAAGDFFDDGSVALAVGAPKYEVDGDTWGAVFVLQNVSGTLSQSVAITYGSAPGQECGTALSAGDVDAVGHDYVVIGCPGLGEVLVYDGATQEHVYTSDVGIAGFGHSLVTGDLDGDGTPEIVAGGDDSASPSLEVVGQQVEVELGIVASPDRLRVLGHGYLDSDANLDLVASADDSAGNHDLVIYFGDGALGVDSHTGFNGGTGPATGDRFGERAALVDADGDAYVDLVLTSPGPSTAAGAAHVYVATGIDPGEHWIVDPDPTQTVDQETALASSCDECATYDHPDGVACGDHDGSEICVFSACVTRGCGDGYRETGAEGYTDPVASRESCDDGNTLAGDACSATCDVSEVAVVHSSAEAEAAGARRAQAVAQDGAANLLFAFTLDTGESRALHVQRANYGGAMMTSTPKGPARTFAVGWEPEASVAGLPSGGWVVVWSDPEVDAAGSGVAMMRVEPDGSLGPVHVANEVPDGDQRAPRVVALTDAVVVVWVDTSGVAGPFAPSSIVSRTFDLSLTPTSGDLRLSDPAERALEPAVAAHGDDWIVAWTEDPLSPFGQPQVFAQRFGASGDAAPTQVSSAAGAEPAVTALDDGDFAVAWVRRDPAVDHRGDVLSAELTGAPGSLTVGAAVVHASQSLHPEQAPAIAALGVDEYLVAYEDGGARTALGYGHTAMSLPSEATTLDGHLGARLQGDVAVLRTPRGVWFTWSADMRGVTLAGLDADADRSVLAFLVPGS